MRLVYGPFEPDKPAFLSSGLQAAANVYRAAVGYRPVGEFVTVMDPLIEAPKGASSFITSSGTSVIAATQHGLYRVDLTAWDSLATGFNAPGHWGFVQFGTIAIATNGTNPVQKIDLATYTVSALAGTPPTARIIAIVKDFVVLGNVGGVTNKLQWSGINNAEFWTVGVNQCDYQYLPTGGEITGILGGEVGIILQRNRISRMTYVGDNLVFQFDEISNNVGCVHANSVIQAGTTGFWLSDTGFMKWDGATISPIGQEVIDRTFAASYNSSNWASMSCAVDLKNNLVAWSMSDRIFVYNWALGAWSIIDKASPYIFAGFSATDPLFYAFDATYHLGTFSGTPMEATFTTGDLELVPGRECRIWSVRPLSDAVEGVSLTFQSKCRQGDEVTESIYDSLEDSGEMAVRESARYVRVSHTIDADTEWTYAEGLDLGVERGARR